jgi:hypothetical protein
LPNQNLVLQTTQDHSEDATEDVAERSLVAVLATLHELIVQPGLGCPRGFRHADLRGMRSFRVAPPFHIHLIFYRHRVKALISERILDGMRDLPRRLRHPPGATSD